MEKRVLLAMVFSLVFLFLYQYVFMDWLKPEPAKKTAGVVSPEKHEEAKGSDAPAPVSVVKQEAPPQPVVPEETVAVETPLYKAVFSSKGAGIKSFELKNYKEKITDDSGSVEMFMSSAEEYQLQDRLIKGAATEALHFKPAKTAVAVNNGQQEELVFAWQSPEGARIEKKYTISGDTYNIRVDTAVANSQKMPFDAQLVTTLSTTKTFIQKRGGSYHKGALFFADGKVVTKDLEERDEIIPGRIGWGGLEEMYFMSVIIPDKIENAKWSTLTTKDIVKTSLAVPLNLAVGGRAEINYSAYIGPKEMDILKAQKVHLEDAIDLGWFTFLAKPFLVAMNFIYVYIPNYGLVIILLTILTKILFHPLTKKGLDSMKEMQRMQPQIALLKEKYKNDREKMNKELMDLYKRYKINPIGGCLPMILQIPVFIALYNVLGTSIELRHAPFMLWIGDLSAPDALLHLPAALPFIGGYAFGPLPLLMGATMFLQQKMTPTAMDPAQAKMMLIMPVIFTFMFLNFPSGLVLYWLVNNVLSIAQQYYIQKTTK